MRALYIPQADSVWQQYYINQANQSGGGFIGIPYQRGSGLGSIFRGIFRALLPIAKTAGKAIGKQALSTGAQIASDVVAGKSIKASAKRRGRTGAAILLRKAANKLQRGKGLGRRKKPAKKRRVPAKKAVTKKRKAPAKRKTTKRKKVADQLGLYYG